MRFVLLATELGLLLLDESGRTLSNFPFPPGERARRLANLTSGSLGEDEVAWISGNVRDAAVAASAEIVPQLIAAGIKTEQISKEESSELSRKRLDLMVASGLASSIEEAESAVRDVSLEMSSLKVKELSSKPDLQAMESVQALDEIDRTANILSARVREWYGLHFPELTSWIDDNPSLMKLILKFRTRDNYDAEELESSMGYSKNKSRAIAEAAKESRGADMREEDLLRVTQLADESLHLFNLRDKLATHVEKTMRQVAPNLSEIAGASIGARLIAKAGGLQKLAILPASTIQILGAEKALYRAMKSGARPPKHGILFQHEAVHSAPKWQRGKIARSVAGKIAIAARIDTYRGSKDESIAGSLKARLDEIKEKYKEAPSPSQERAHRRPTQREDLRRQRFRVGGGEDQHGRRGGGEAFREGFGEWKKQKRKNKQKGRY